jgi:hypothetical protein
MEGAPTEDTRMALGGTTDREMEQIQTCTLVFLDITFTFVKYYLHGNLRLDIVSHYLQMKQNMWYYLKKLD